MAEKSKKPKKPQKPAPKQTPRDTPYATGGGASENERRIAAQGKDGPHKPSHLFTPEELTHKHPGDNAAHRASETAKKIRAAKKKGK